MQSPLTSLKELHKIAKKLTIDTRAKIEGDLIITAPVDTGRFKSDWDSILGKKYTFSVVNTVPYGSILAGGRRQARNGMMIGSLQWRLGIAPMVDDWEQYIIKRLKNELT